MPAINIPSDLATKTVHGLLHIARDALSPRTIESHKHDSAPWSELSPRAQAIYFIILGIPSLLTIYLFWRRCRRLTFKTLRHMTYIRSLVILSYILAITFTFTSFALVINGISSLSLCRNAIYVCIGFLFAGKVTMQLFLIERAHVANINYDRRRDDPIWCMSILLLSIAGLGVVVWTYINPVYYMSSKDGRCRKGLPPSVVAPIQALELTLNLFLTVIFVQMLRRSRMCKLFAREPERQINVTASVIEAGKRFKANRAGKAWKNHHHETSSRAPAATDAAEEECKIDGAGRDDQVHAVTNPFTSPDSSTKQEVSDTSSVISMVAVLPASTRPSRLRSLARKSLIGTLFMLCWTITNCSVFYVTRGRENAWLCFIQCNLDVLLSVFVLHWLTSNPKDDKRPYTGDTRSSVVNLPTFNSNEGSGSDTDGSSVHRSNVLQVPVVAAKKAFDRVTSSDGSRSFQQRQ